MSNIIRWRYSVEDSSSRDSQNLLAAFRLQFKEVKSTGKFIEASSSEAEMPTGAKLVKGFYVPIEFPVVGEPTILLYWSSCGLKSIRTSPVVKVEEEEGVLHTENSIYLLVQRFEGGKY